MTRQNFRNPTRQNFRNAHGDGHWRATFYVTGLAHSILGGTAWEPTVWRAVQRAGWDAMNHAALHP